MKGHLAGRLDRHSPGHQHNRKQERKMTESSTNHEITRGTRVRNWCNLFNLGAPGSKRKIEANLSLSAPGRRIRFELPARFT
jgi:hypothetical protein